MIGASSDFIKWEDSAGHMKERIFIDQTEIVAGVTLGTQATRMSWKADELQEITIMKWRSKSCSRRKCRK